MNEKSSDSWQNRALCFIVNSALLASGLTCLWAGSVSAYNVQTTPASILLVAGIVLLFAATIDRFESIKGLGMEAKTKKLNGKYRKWTN